MNFLEANLSEQKIIGIATKADNSASGAQKIAALWQKFYQEKVLDKISDKVSDEIFAIYTDYESDHTKSYKLILGVKVFDFENIPQGMISHVIPEQKYKVFTALGKMPQAVAEEWKKIWTMDLKREYSSDFEIYNEDSNQGDDSEVEIYIAVK
jgi:predicted transcriptional regulator YdeE